MITGEYIFAASAILGASIIRGYSGFGFAMICAITLSFIPPPSQVTPVILCLDVVASAWLLYKVRREVDWKGLKLIGFGALLTLALGTLAIVSICYGLIDRQTLTLSLGLFIPLGVGIWIGNFLFGKFSNEAALRKQVILLLMVISTVSLVKFTFLT